MSDDMIDDLASIEAELAALAKTLSVADTHLDEPPAAMWAGIEALVAAGDPSLAPAAPRPGSVRPFRRRMTVALGVAASLLLVAGIVVNLGSDTRLDEVSEVALSNDGLAPEGASSHADATLVRLADGEYALDLTVDDLPAAGDGFLELWIIDTRVEGMYSLGPLHGNGLYPLPAHIDPAAFPVVDISIEPADGAPTHSGQSILRGQLPV